MQNCFTDKNYFSKYQPWELCAVVQSLSYLIVRNVFILELFTSIVDHLFKTDAFEQLNGLALSNIATAAANWNICNLELFEATVERVMTNYTLFAGTGLDASRLLIRSFAKLSLSVNNYPQFTSYYINVIQWFAQNIHKANSQIVVSLLFSAFKLRMLIDRFPQLETSYEIIIKYAINNLDQMNLGQLCSICLYASEIGVMNASLFSTSIQRACIHLNEYMKSPSKFDVLVLGEMKEILDCHLTYAETVIHAIVINLLRACRFFLSPENIHLIGNPTSLHHELWRHIELYEQFHSLSKHFLTLIETRLNPDSHFHFTSLLLTVEQFVSDAKVLSIAKGTS